MEWICLAMVMASYALGHAQGYRLCKLKVKNLVKKYMHSHTPELPPIESLLTEVCKL